MAYSTKVFAAERLGLGVLHGTVGINDLMDASRALYTTEAWRPRFDACWDCRAVRALVLEPTDTAALLDHLEPLRPRFARSRTALVVPRRIDHMMARMLMSKMHVPARRYQTFSRLPHALQWLGRPNENHARIERYAGAQRPAV